MLFNSFNFLIFFPIVISVFFLIPQRVKWIWLLLASYYFYMSWNPQYAILMLTSTAITFASGILITNANKIKNERKRIISKKLWVAFSLLSNLGILFFFKYFDFFLGNINSILSNINVVLDPPLFDILLPVGISFYTFQALSYTIDVYRGEIEATKNFGKYALFVSFFPQLVAGPIERSKDLLPQISEEQRFEYNRFKKGLMLMLWGLFQKMVIADNLAILVNQVYNNNELYMGFQLVLATVCFAGQIYCDFGAYSNIAIGAAEVMGFRLTNNFNQPYFSKSISEFWRRWHISLGRWFRDYLYIPLGGNRVSKAKKNRNIILVFVASGLWHGASWNFIVWGALHGGYQVIGNLMQPLREKAEKKLIINSSTYSYKFLQICITFFLVCVAWVFFRANNIGEALNIIKNSFYFNPWIFTDGSLLNMGMDIYQLIVTVGAVSVLIISSLMSRNGSIRDKIMGIWLPWQWVIFLVAIFAILIFGVYGIGFEASQFIYFQF